MGCLSSKEILPTRCYLDVKIGAAPCAERMVVKLRPDVVPRTCKNFIMLCKGHQGRGYAGSKLHRVVPGGVIQGGECGSSIYGPNFKDESFSLEHQGRGTLYMANEGSPDTNGSQFWFCPAERCTLHTKFVVFGKLESGFEVLEKIEQVKTLQGSPEEDVIITACGVLDEEGGAPNDEPAKSNQL
mmetsp:Transcript_23905/g.52216  ORF Transcript_23905/g.52216 Transcript_23905/m.52216 type:complete len:185 (+) Transcript_23905:122-676(+)|eukprot:CAMPEP_0118943972 /NCGR_PEP_ID=MMETSP1169-20130426/39371_1 /TAXON_ID=36882 /ORGANISM="Pyramimonas obovata, Strain CCMP722" /LENGTH=184 /DNA_ID=CAMNT_0006889343 /DNA_START=88 /DNA_END=642 /DNA_ORIENTATION=-